MGWAKDMLIFIAGCYVGYFLTAIVIGQIIYWQLLNRRAQGQDEADEERI